MTMSSDGSIVITVDLNDKDYESRLASMEGKTKSFGTQVKSFVSAIGITKGIAYGFDMIKSSIGGAMNRIDTMNQFNRVMTVMTGSTEEAKKALEELKGITKGTAYGLDVAAASTQKLVTSGMDLSNAVPQIKTWGDAVAFYGDGSNESFANVADAISKMTSKGKVEMDQLNRLFDSGIPAVEIYASYVGKSSQEVQNELSKGVISAQQFTDGLTQAMRDGTDSFASIDGAAKEAGASWSATFDNMKAAVTRGMVNIITAIDEALTSNGLPTMREMISDVGKAFEFVLSAIGERIPEIIATIQTLLPYIISIGNALLAWKVITFIQGIPAMLAKVKTALIALNAVMIANPIGVVVALIAALVTAFLYFWNTSEEFRQFWYDLWDGIVVFFSSVVDKIVEFFTITIPLAWEAFKIKLGELGESIKQMFQDAWNNVISFFSTTIPSWIQSVIDWFAKIPYNIGYFLGQVAGQFVQWGIDLWTFLTVDIPNFIEGVVNWFAELPARISEWLIKAWDELKQWGIDTYDTAIEWISKTIDGIVSWFASLPEKIWKWLCTVASNIVAWGSDIWSKGKAAAENLFNAIVDVVKTIPGKMFDIGKNIVQGIWDGIVGAKDWISDQISGFCDGLVGGFMDFLGIHSPSRIMRDMIGKFLPPGIAIGFEMAVPDATKDMRNATNSMVTGLQKEIDLSTGKLSTGVSLEQTAQVSRQTSIVNRFPKTFTLAGDGMQAINLVLTNGAELAHALIDPLNKELGLQ